jgi:hypothetical protein
LHRNDATAWLLTPHSNAAERKRQRDDPPKSDRRRDRISKDRAAARKLLLSLMSVSEPIVGMHCHKHMHHPTSHWSGVDNPGAAICAVQLTLDFLNLEKYPSRIQCKDDEIFFLCILCRSIATFSFRAIPLCDRLIAEIRNFSQA